MDKKFKQELEVACDIAQWSPTEPQLLKIANYVRNNPSKVEFTSEYIIEACNEVVFHLNEGVDNSDLNYLLALAIKYVEEEKVVE